MKFFGKAIAISVIGLGLASGVQADTLATWTFESTLPATAGPIAAEVGAGSALGSHASGAAVYSSPVGNGSAHSFSSNNWTVGDYYQFSVSTAGFTGINLSWDQTSSGTGPVDFKLAYSTNGSTFTDVATYQVLANASPNPVWNSSTASALYTKSQNLSSLTGVDNQSTVYFRLIDTSTISAGGGAVGTGGTDRIDNFTVSGTSVSAVPVPAAIWLLGSGLMSLGGLFRRRRIA
jgi:hypothetical protein